MQRLHSRRKAAKEQRVRYFSHTGRKGLRPDITSADQTRLSSFVLSVRSVVTPSLVLVAEPQTDVIVVARNEPSSETGTVERC